MSYESSSRMRPAPPQQMTREELRDAIADGIRKAEHDAMIAEGRMLAYYREREAMPWWFWVCVVVIMLLAIAYSCSGRFAP